MRHPALLPGPIALPIALLLARPRNPASGLAPPLRGIARADRSAVKRLRDAWSRDFADGRNARPGQEPRRRATAQALAKPGRAEEARAAENAAPPDGDTIEARKLLAGR